MNHQNRPFRINGPFMKPQRVHVTVEPGKVAFRLLCPIAAVGGLIGSSGPIIQGIELQSSSKIHIEDALTADSNERLVYVVGPEAVDQAVSFRNLAGDGEFEDRVFFDVSSAQKALLRVYERILEVDRSVQLNGGGGVMRCCRLLATGVQIAALIGRDGENVDMIREETGSYVRVFKADNLPQCPSADEELIQITGDSVAVRKALILVSKCLQENQGKDKAASTVVVPPYVSSSYGDQNIGSSSTPSAGNVTGSNIVEVVFRLLIPSEVAECVIGKGGSKLKAIEDERGAFLHFASQVPGCNERVITISAMENVEIDHSAAQDAIVDVIITAREALAKKGIVSKQTFKEAFTCRLLIPPHQVGYLIGGGGTIIAKLQRWFNTRIQILDGDQVPPCASNDDRVVQIVGSYMNATDALVEVTQKIREGIFNSKGLKVEQVLDETHTLEDQMEDVDSESGDNEDSVVTSVTVACWGS